MTARITSHELLAVADLLLAQHTSANPRPVHLRRAVSSAYYALFHELVSEAAYRVAGSDSSRKLERDTISRWYTHGDVRTVSRWVASSAEKRKIPDPVVPLLVLTQPATRYHIGRAYNAIARLPSLRGERTYENFLCFFLGGPKLAVR